MNPVHRVRELVITPSAGGWSVSDSQGRIPPSYYRDAEEAEAAAREYLAGHGGGRVSIREGGTVVSADAVAGEGVRPPSRS